MPDESGSAAGGLKAFAFLVAVAVVAGLILFIVEAPFSHSAPASSQGKPQPASANAPSVSPPQPHSASPSPSDSSAASVSTVRILKPVNQPGFAFLWREQITIGLAGVTFDRNGYQIGSGDNYNLQYNPDGSPPGWSYFNGVFEYWQPGTTPGPANCLGQNNVAEGVEPASAASVGARYYFYNYDPSPIVVYMQVTQVRSSAVTVDAWAWLQTSGSN